MPPAPLTRGAIGGIVTACVLVIIVLMYIAVCSCLPVRCLPPADILRLYQLMKDADELFAKHGMSYLVESGTLLGVARHGGIIPIDDDLDIQVRREDEGALVATLLPAFEALGYGWKYWPFGYKVYYRNLFQFPFLDIFIVHDDGVRTHIKDGSFNKCHYLLSEIQPITRYKFGETYVNGPRDPAGFLTRAYGSHWRDTWVAMFSHAHFVYYFAAKPQKMVGTDFHPAQPTGPLADRVAK